MCRRSSTRVRKVFSYSKYSPIFGKYCNVRKQFDVRTILEARTIFKCSGDIQMRRVFKMFGKVECSADIQIVEKYSRCLESGRLKNCSENIQLRDAGRLFGKDSKCSESIQDVRKEMKNGRKIIKKVRKVFEKLSESIREAFGK
jgi:hypothetical protein